MASQPATWENTSTNGYFVTFGTWGQEKMRFIIGYIGYTTFDEPLDNVDMRRFPQSLSPQCNGRIPACERSAV